MRGGGDGESLRDSLLCSFHTPVGGRSGGRTLSRVRLFGVLEGLRNFCAFIVRRQLGLGSVKSKNVNGSETHWVSPAARPAMREPSTKPKCEIANSENANKVLTNQKSALVSKIMSVTRRDRLGDVATSGLI